MSNAEKETVFHSSDEQYYFRRIRRWGRHTLVLCKRDEPWAVVIFETTNGKVFDSVFDWLYYFDVDTLKGIARARDERRLA